MKLLIITLHRVYNYGSVLQAYATQKAFEKKGFDVAIIDYITSQRTKRNIFKLSADGSNRNMPLIVYRFFKFFSIILKDITFGSFINKYLKLTKKYVTPDDLTKDPPYADVYVTGSDQTWNSDYNQGVDRGFFLGFIENKPKVSFASSFGKNSLDEHEISETKKYIETYKLLSVRESTGIEILKTLGRFDGIQLIDPTLLLTRREWLNVASKRIVKRPYLILMLLYNEDNSATEYAREIADDKNLELVKLSWEMKKPYLVDRLFTHRSPADFLSLFANADFVVTNSFHGLAFSLNLERQFIVVPRNEYNSRIESLLSIVGLEDRMVSTLSDAKNQSLNVIDYNSVNNCLQNERNRAMDYINSIKGLVL